jgi:tRNA threonylcarbamoyladenosine biosynthesis protein TsaB
MNILALDTTTRSGSVALVIDDDVVDERAGDASRSHAERLPSEILSLLDAHDLSPSSIDLFAIASGPGLFTGLRIGIATMQGMALVAGKPMAGVSALAALGHAAGRDRAAGVRIGVWMDAHRRDVFASLFDVASANDRSPFSAERLIDREGPTVGDPRATIARWIAAGQRPDLITGDGAVKYREVIAAVDHSIAVVPDRALAGTIGVIARERARRGDVVPPGGIQPLYVRRPDAELAREHALADRSADVARRD